MISNPYGFYKGENCFKIILDPNMPTQQSFIASLLNIITKIIKGHSFTPSSTTSNSFEKQLFFININHKTSLKRIKNETATTTTSSNITTHDIKFCGQKFNIYPAFAYYSPTHTVESPNFFICFILDQLITNEDQSRLIIQVLNNLFGNSDLSHENPKIFPCANKGLYNYEIFDRDESIIYNDILIAKKQIIPNYPIPIIRNNHKSDMKPTPTKLINKPDNKSENEFNISKPMKSTKKSDNHSENDPKKDSKNIKKNKGIVYFPDPVVYT